MRGQLEHQIANTENTDNEYTKAAGICARNRKRQIHGHDE